MHSIFQTSVLLWGHLREQFGRRIWLWAGLLVLTPVTEGMAVFLILPLFQSIGLRAEGEQVPQETFADALGVGDNLLAMVLLLLGAIVVHECTKWVQVRTHARFHWRFVASLREDLFRAMARARWAALANLRTSNLHKTITEDVDRAFATLTAAENLSLSVVISAAYLFMAIWVSPLLTTLVIVGSATYLMLLRRPIDYMDQLGQRVAETYGELYGTIAEYLTFIRTFKSYGKVEDAIGRFESSSGEIADIHIKETDIRANLEVVYKIAGALGLCGFIYVALGLLAIPAASFFFVALILSRVALRIPAIVADGLGIAINGPSPQECTGANRQLRGTEGVHGNSSIGRDHKTDRH